MGQQSTKTVNESLIDIVNKSLTKLSISQLQNHSARYAGVQRVNAESETGDISIKGVNMKNTVSISLQSYQEIMNKDTITNSVSSSIDKYVRNISESAGVTLSSSNTETVNINKTKVLNDIRTIINTEQINNCIATAFSEQSLNVKTKSGNIKIENIDITSLSEVSAKCISSLINEVLNNNNTENKIKEDIMNNSKSKSALSELGLSFLGFNVYYYIPIILSVCSLSSLSLLLIILIIFAR